MSLVVFSSLWGGGQTAWSGSKKETVVVSVPVGGWPPYMIIDDEDGFGNRGIMLDVLITAAQTLGYGVKVVAYPNKRNMLLLREGKIDACPRAREWVPFFQNFYWTDPVVDSADILISRADAPVSYARMEELKDLDIGVVHGFMYPKLDPYFGRGLVRRHAAHTTNQLLGMVLFGHVDAIATNRRVAEWIIKNDSNMNVSDFYFHDNPVGVAPFRFAFAKNPFGKMFTSRFNRELAAMRKDGRLREILNRY